MQTGNVAALLFVFIGFRAALLLRLGPILCRCNDGRLLAYAQVAAVQVGRQHKRYDGFATFHSLRSPSREKSERVHHREYPKHTRNTPDLPMRKRWATYPD